MLQAIGLTSTHRRDRRLAVEDLSFQADPGCVTALLGARGAGKTTALRLMLELEQGRGITFFRGLPLHRITSPAGEVGILLGDVPGHPARTVRNQLRMLCAASGVRGCRADELLEMVGLGGLAGHRVGALSLGMDRRLGLAAALLADPHTLLLDEPVAGLAPSDTGWLFGLLRSHAAQGGTVLYTTSDPKAAARYADHVVTIDSGRLVADQDAAEFARTRLRPRVAVRTPHTARLAGFLTREARASQRSVEVVTESGSRLSVYGSSCAEVGDTAFRHGIPVHQLADETGDMKPPGLPDDHHPESVKRLTREPLRAEVSESLPAPPAALVPAGRVFEGGADTSPPIVRRPDHGPVRPMRYELHRLFGVRVPLLIAGAVLFLSAVLAALLGRSGQTPVPQLLAAWPRILPLPPAALGAGLLGSLAFGDEYRYPALAARQGVVPRRFGLLAAKLAVSAGTALFLAVTAAVADLATLHLLYGGDLSGPPQDWLHLLVSWAGLTVGCAWAGLLGAGVFRSTTAGLAAVLAVPVVMVPLLQAAIAGPAARSVVGLPTRLRELAWVEWPHQADRWMIAILRLLTQPVAAALALSLSVLLCAFLFTGVRGRARW
ncbi:ATP-binding cassette domain-containing protein [Streptomyces sp. NPDC051320]|uniref:ATP-binding cassette domain-containing protein n=1 Tax=Streptomyces sp. NPDC051320 TaxID=3154644 RepID=UPI003431FDC6